MKYEYHIIDGVGETSLGSLNEILTDLGDQGFAIVHVGQDFAIMQREVTPEYPEEDMSVGSSLYNLSEYMRQILQIIDHAENRMDNHRQLESKLVDAFKQLDEKGSGRLAVQKS